MLSPRRGANGAEEQAAGARPPARASISVVNAAAACTWKLSGACLPVSVAGRHRDGDEQQADAGAGHADAGAEEGVIAAGYDGRRSPSGQAGEPVMVVVVMVVVVVVIGQTG